MHTDWILAQASPNAPEVIKSQPVEKGATTTQQVAPDGNSAAAKPAQKPEGAWMQYGLLILIFVIMYFIMFRGPKKQQQKQKQMIESLKKNDRVQTIGGILGTVLDVKDNEITIKIDESNNTKMRIIPGAVSRVITEEK
jgi:preprotein translocase subunit YajC